MKDGSSKPIATDTQGRLSCLFAHLLKGAIKRVGVMERARELRSTLALVDGPLTRVTDVTAGAMYF